MMRPVRWCLISSSEASSRRILAMPRRCPSSSSCSSLPSRLCNGTQPERRKGNNHATASTYPNKRRANAALTASDQNDRAVRGEYPAGPRLYLPPLVYGVGVVEDE